MLLSWTRTVPAIDDRSDEDLVDLARGGDDLALLEVLERFKPLVRSKGRTYFLAGGDRQDVTQEGMIGLFKAVRDYDRTKHPSFRHFADLCVTRQVITAVKGATRHKHTPLNRYVPLNGFADGDDGELDHVDRIADVAADPAQRVASSAELATLKDYCLEVLTDLEGEVLARYVAGDSYTDIAADLGRHTKAIDNALQRIKRKLGTYVDQRALATLG